MGLSGPVAEAGHNPALQYDARDYHVGWLVSNRYASDLSKGFQIPFGRTAWKNFLADNQEEAISSQLRKHLRKSRKMEFNGLEGY